MEQGRGRPIGMSASPRIVLRARRFYRQSTKQPAIIDRYGAKLVSEVTREFISM